MAFLAEKYKIIYFGNLEKEMNERKLKKLLHSFGVFEISQNWSFLRFPHLTSWRLLWPREVLFEVWLMQPSCLKDSIVQSLTRSFLLGVWQATVHGVTRVGHNLATKPPWLCISQHSFPFFLAFWWAFQCITQIELGPPTQVVGAHPQMSAPLGISTTTGGFLTSGHCSGTAGPSDGGLKSRHSHRPWDSLVGSSIFRTAEVTASQLDSSLCLILLFPSTHVYPKNSP